jgi:DNA-binding GntR family transcriptional regulator
MPEKHLTKTEIALQGVREQLRDGSLKPGQRLRLNELTHDLAMSATPIREALRLLQADGLIEYRPHHGIVVAELSENATDEVYALRAMLEPFAAELAVTKMTRKQLDELELLHERIVRAAARPTTNITAVSDRNREWHSTLYELSDSPILLDFIRRLWDAFPWRTAWSLPERTHLSLTEHKAVMEAIREADPKLTSSRMREHILSGRATVLNQIRLDLADSL